MKYIAIQPYYKVEREVSGTEQKVVVQDRNMYLYEGSIVTKHREFPIVDVFDLSYRRIGGDGGLLYLHTKQGVFSYTVQGDPQPFIEAYMALVHPLSDE